MRLKLHKELSILKFCGTLRVQLCVKLHEYLVPELSGHLAHAPEMVAAGTGHPLSSVAEENAGNILVFT